MRSRSASLSAADAALNAMVLAAIGAPLVGCAFALVASFAWDPAAIARQEHVSWLGASFSPCPGCAMCGMSRAFSALSHGDWALARALNPAVVVFYPLFWLVVAALVIGVVRLVRNPIRVTPQRRLAPA